MAGSRRSRGSRKGSRKQQRRRKSTKNAVQGDMSAQSLPGNLGNADIFADYAAAFGNNIQQSIMSDAAQYDATGGFGYNGGGTGPRPTVTFTPTVSDPAVALDIANLTANPALAKNFTTKNFGSTQPQVGAVITLYVTNTCGTCAYVKDSVLPNIIDKYTNAWKTALAAGGTGNKPPLISFLINMLPSSDPQYLPPGVDSVPAITIDRINPNGSYVNPQSTVLYQYKDWLDNATGNPRWARLGYASQFANEFIYTWLPRSWRLIDPLLWEDPYYVDYFDTFFTVL